MRKWILMLVCVLTLSALSVCFAEDSDNSGEVTAQQSYVNEAITVTSETSADAPSQSPVLRDVAYMTQGGRQLIIKLYDIDSDYPAECGTRYSCADRLGTSHRQVCPSRFPSAARAVHRRGDSEDPRCGLEQILPGVRVLTA